MDGLHREYRAGAKDGIAGDAVVHGRHAGRDSRHGSVLSVLAFRALAPIVGFFAKGGRLDINYRDFASAGFDSGAGPRYAIRIESLRMFLRLLRNPDLGSGESYMNGEWRMEHSDLGGWLSLASRNEGALYRTRTGRTITLLSRIVSGAGVNDPEKSRANVAHHYDIGNDLYEAFLDEGMNYSCAFYESPEQSLRGAQLNKLRTTARRLGVGPDMRVLDIGSGWGELTRIIAGETEAAQIAGITLAKNQLELAKKRAGKRFGNQLHYRLADYRVHARENPGAYDRIVSIGMFEHVGRPQFVDYFKAVKRLMTEDGQALVHTILRPRRAETSTWIKKYIFPGGYIPALDDMVAAARAAGLELAHEPFIHESFHYANTLRHWRRRFNDAWPGLSRARYDERFRRMWNFYLAASESAFDSNGLHVGQILLRKV